MTQWTAENPSLGSLDALTTFHYRVGSLRESIGEFQGSFTRHISGIASVWEGPASTAWQTMASATATRMSTMEQELQEAQRAVGRYEHALWEIRSGCEGVRSQIERTLADIAKVQARLNVELAVDPTGIFAHNEQQRLASAQAELAQAEHRLEVLAEQREEADHAFARALDRVLSEDWVAASPMFPQAMLTAYATAMAPMGTPPDPARRFLDILDHDPSQKEINAAWTSLSTKDQDWLIHNRPVRIGNLDGVPFEARDRANRRELARQLKKIDDTIAEAEWEWSIHLTNEEQLEVLRGRTGLTHEQVNAMRNLDSQLNRRKEARLVAFDIKHGPTRAAIALGDLDTATHIGIYVSGVGTRIGKTGQLDGYLNKTAALRREAARVLARAEKGTSKDDLATVYWYGYRAPDDDSIVTALVQNRARAGGPHLASFGEGIEAVNPGGRTTLAAHSYGSLVASFAVTETDSFDSFVAFGSPGLCYSELREYQVPVTERYYGRAKGDAIAATEWHGHDLGELGFEKLPTWEVGEYSASSGHSEYLNSGTSFQRSLAAIIADHPEAVPGW